MGQFSMEIRTLTGSVLGGNQQTLGFRNVFDGIFDPELGDIGKIRQIPILSEKGSLADLLMRDVKKIMAMRDLLNARIDTDRQIAGLKAA